MSGVTVPAPGQINQAKQCDCHPPKDDELTDARDRSRDGERWVCPDGRAWQLFGQPGLMSLEWKELHGFAAWRARRAAREVKAEGESWQPYSVCQLSPMKQRDERD